MPTNCYKIFIGSRLYAIVSSMSDAESIHFWLFDTGIEYDSVHIVGANIEGTGF